MVTSAMFGRVLDYATQQKIEFVNLTETVEQLIAESGVQDGIAVIQSLHSTAALFVNEWQNALLDDFRTMLEQAVSADAPWQHNDPRYSDCDRSNAVSHLRALLLGTSAVLAVRSGRVIRGVWQSIILAEMDGPRSRSVSVQIFGA
jgi:secondary thiamine-phosphate synthase enzyme